MSGKMSSMSAFMIMMAVTSMLLDTSVAQTRHVVGDALGWTIPPNGAAAYTTWAAQQTFTVGDTLFFNFTTGNHNVAEVPQAAYGPCTTTNPTTITTTGPATITLTAPGTHYYLCAVGTHCQLGQKLTINVSAPAAAPTTPPAAAPTTLPPAAAPTTTPPAPTPTSAPTPAPMTPAPAPTTTTAPPTSSEAPTPAADSPPAPTTTGPSPAGSTTPPPPSPSAAAGALTGVAPAALLAFALALFY
ncbi:hypothetical protein SSX86_009926 [Deinandra increscens subsp. villosa]|uniref:Phytocyanin domain-containing protein n=1 Tax=Deinandra increscens subsp. villosa TaxID=3103831 RepID=A0AAP0DEA2_9ASTR